MEDSGLALKWIAAVIAICLVCCAVFILKTDPIRNESPERTHAVQQVKQFAQFIETRPSFPKNEPPVELTQTKKVSVLAEELERRLKNNESQDSQFIPFLIEHQSELLQELSNLFPDKNTLRNSLWEKKMELLKLIFEQNDFSEDLKLAALRLFSLELLSARTDPAQEVQQKADHWAEDYMKAEHRLAFKNAFIAAYELRRGSTGQAKSSD